MTDQLYIDDFERDPIVLFDRHFGFAINPKTNTLRIFRKADSGTWKHQCFDLGMLRKIERIELAPAEFTSFGGGVGGAIGMALRESMERSKAAKGTGVRIYLRSVDTPSVFVRIAAEKLEAAYEALNQVADRETPNGAVRSIPPAISQAFYRPTAEEIAHEKSKVERADRRREAMIPTGKTIIASFVGAGIAIWPTYLIYRELVFANVGRYPRLPMSEDLTIFYPWWLGIIFVLITSWKVIRA